MILYTVVHGDHDEVECPDRALCLVRVLFNREYRIVTLVSGGDVVFDLGSDVGRVRSVVADYREHSLLPWRLESRIVGSWIEEG